MNDAWFADWAAQDKAAFDQNQVDLLNGQKSQEELALKSALSVTEQRLSDIVSKLS